jgi:hypothetical protein
MNKKEEEGEEEFLAKQRKTRLISDARADAAAATHKKNLIHFSLAHTKK